MPHRSNEEISQEVGKLFDMVRSGSPTNKQKRPNTRRAPFNTNPDEDEVDSGVANVTSKRKSNDDARPDVDFKMRRKTGASSVDHKEERVSHRGPGGVPTVVGFAKAGKPTKIDCRVKSTGRAPLATPEDSVVTPGVSLDLLNPFGGTPNTEAEAEDDGIYDDIDGHGDSPTKGGNSSQDDALFSEVADKLRHIGDKLDSEKFQGKSDLDSVFGVAIKAEIVQSLNSNLTCEAFTETVLKYVQQEPEVSQFVILFGLVPALTRKTLNSQTAQDIRRVCTDYFSSRLSGWFNKNDGLKGVSRLLPASS